jgi:hypothetical protein
MTRNSFCGSRNIVDLRPPMAVFFAYDGHAISLWQKSAKGVVAMCYITTHMVCVVRCGEKRDAMILWISNIPFFRKIFFAGHLLP